MLKLHMDNKKTELILFFGLFDCIILALIIFESLQVRTITLLLRTFLHKLFGPKLFKFGIFDADCVTKAIFSLNSGVKFQKCKKDYFSKVVFSTFLLRFHNSMGRSGRMIIIVFRTTILPIFFIFSNFEQLLFSSLALRFCTVLSL